MAYWSKLAERFAANDNVIGYDILNEPWPANIYHDAELFLKPETFDREKLYPFSQRANSVVREKDAATIVFFEPAQFPDTLPFFGGMVYNMGFPDSPGGASDIQQAVNDHSYCCQADAMACETGEPPLSLSDKCRAFHFDKAAIRADDAKRYGVPMMFTEFGACFNSIECATEITNAADAYDS
jgi:endoglycosylceramidase